MSQPRSNMSVRVIFSELKSNPNPNLIGHDASTQLEAVMPFSPVYQQLVLFAF